MNHIDYSEFDNVKSGPLDPKAEKLLRQRYYHWTSEKRTGMSRQETWPELVRRVTRFTASGRAKEPGRKEYRKAFERIVSARLFLPNSPLLAGAGTANGAFACFVVGPDRDSLSHHLEVLADIAQVGKKGGGCGFSGTNIRAKGSFVAGSAHQRGSSGFTPEEKDLFGIAYGPNWWAAQVGNYLGGITQGGFRKMALMYTLDAKHPDIHDFINAKQSGDESVMASMNQSVFISDDIMEKATEDATSPEGLLLQEIAQSAWNNGEPGLLFDDTINSNTPYSICDCGKIIATNPCGEQPLPAYGSCNLGSINLAHDWLYNEDGSFNFERLNTLARFATRMLDDVGEKNKFPTKKFASWYADHRPIGIGIMGLADLYLRLEIAYGSGKALSVLERIWKTISAAARYESVILGQQRGVPAHCHELGRRNMTLTTVAPTGSISMIAGVWGGIEPYYSPEFGRTDERGEKYVYTHPKHTEAYWRSAISQDSAKEVTMAEHIATQAVSQRYVDSAVSKTVNLPESATVEDVVKVYSLAWKSGCKGVTVYRNNSRQVQVLAQPVPVAAKAEPAPTVLVSSNGNTYAVDDLRVVHAKAYVGGNEQKNPALDEFFDPTCPTGICTI